MALACLATGEPGIVTWAVDDYALLLAHRVDLRSWDTSAKCAHQFCSGGIHILTGDGKLFTQTRKNVDLTSEVSRRTPNGFLATG